MTEQEAIIILNAVSGIGNRTILRLIAFFGCALAALRAGREALSECGHLTPKQVEAILSFPCEEFLRRELELIRRHNVTALTFFEEDYPVPLRHVADAPSVLYVKGKLPKDWERCIAIVGSRQASLYGQSLAAGFARQLGERGFTIVSGLAKGIDRSAHEGCLNVGASTVAVVGCGLEHIYPREHALLYARIGNEGAIISEFSMEMMPLPVNFPRRNRIISGLAQGVLVVEASAKSGALITADFANDQGKNVYAIPGPIDKPGSAGTHALIKDGAKMVTRLDDILEDYEMEAPLERETESDRRDPELSIEEKVIYQFINDRPLHLDEIVEGSGLHASGVSRILLALELKHVIKQLPGKNFRRSKDHEQDQ
jgi:DNA processing protein